MFPEGVYEIKANYGGLQESSKIFSIVSERNSMSENSSIGSGNPNASIPGKIFF